MNGHGGLGGGGALRGDGTTVREIWSRAIPIPPLAKLATKFAVLSSILKPLRPLRLFRPERKKSILLLMRFGLVCICWLCFKILHDSSDILDTGVDRMSNCVGYHATDCIWQTRIKVLLYSPLYWHTWTRIVHWQGIPDQSTARPLKDDTVRNWKSEMWVSLLLAHYNLAAPPTESILSALNGGYRLVFPVPLFVSSSVQSYATLSPNLVTSLSCLNSPRVMLTRFTWTGENASHFGVTLFIKKGSPARNDATPHSCSSLFSFVYASVPTRRSWQIQRLRLWNSRTLRLGNET